MTDKKAKRLGVKDMAKHYKRSAAMVRNCLRNAKIKHGGKSYGWDSLKAMVADGKKAGLEVKTSARRKVASRTSPRKAAKKEATQAAAA